MTVPQWATGANLAMTLPRSSGADAVSRPVEPEYADLLSQRLALGKANVHSHGLPQATLAARSLKILEKIMKISCPFA